MEQKNFWEFNFKKSEIKKALNFEKSFIFKVLKYRNFFLFFLIVSALLKNKFFFFFFLTLFLLSIEFDFYLNSFEQKTKKSKNLADYFTLEVARIFEKSLNFAKKRKIGKFQDSILLYFLLKESKEAQYLLLKSGILPDLFLASLKNEIESFPRSASFFEISPSLKEAFQKIVERQKRISVFTLLGEISFLNSTLKRELFEKGNLKSEEFSEFCEFFENFKSNLEKSKRFWEKENLVKIGTFGRDFAAGWTPYLDRFSLDLTKLVKKEKFREYFAHEKEVEMAEIILGKEEKHNLLIVGNPGSGRKSMLISLARKFALGQSLENLNFKKIKILDLPTLISQIPSIEELELILDRIFKEAERAGNVVLVIENLHHYVGVEKEEKRVGTIDLVGILSPYLLSPDFFFVGITDYLGLHTRIENYPEFLNQFSKVEIKEVSQNETLKILLDRALRYEGKLKVFVSFPAIKEIISLSEKYLPSLPFPEKAIEILDEAISLAKTRKEKIVTLSIVKETLKRKVEIPIGEIEEKEREILLNLEELLHKRVINQENAIKEVAEALKRGRAEIRLRKGPIGSFLFLGPTGVGKTETAKALAEIYFGSEKNMVRLDMSEFQNIEDIKRLLGEPGKEGLLTTPILENPFSLLLLDEFEKAHPKILNLFLQILDEGFVTDGLGRKVDFRNTIIIGTSNAGSVLILKAIEEKWNWEKTKEEVLKFIFENGIFSPELINRFDAVCLYYPLSEENLLEIVHLQLSKIKKQLEEKGIYFEIDEKLKKKIVDLGYDPRFGAREIQRVIQTKVGNLLAEAILKEEIKKGDKIKIDPEKWEVLKLI